MAPVGVTGARQRALLALLLIHRNELLASERIIDALWGARPPPSAAKAVQNAVSQVRRALATGDDGPLRTEHGGYLLRVAPGELDADRFEALLAAGRRSLTRGDAATAADQLREALALWRGPALADLAYEAFAQPEIARLEELRLEALEERIAADLALGRHEELIARARDDDRAQRRCESACAVSSCSPSTAAGARPTPWRCIATRADCSWKSSASSPGASCVSSMPGSSPRMRVSS